MKTKLIELSRYERQLLRECIDAKTTLHGTLCPGDMTEDELEDHETEKRLLAQLKRRLQ